MLKQYSKNVKKYKSSEAKKYADYLSILHDLKKSKYTLNLIEPELKKGEDANTILIQTVWSAAVISYCRCWASGKRYGLNKDFLESLPGDAVGLHDWIKGMRDKLIAHSVNPFEDCTVFLAHKGTSMNIGHFFGQYIHPNYDGIANFFFLIDEIIKKVQSHAEDLQKALESEVNSLTPEELEKLEDFKFVAPGPDAANKAR